MYSPGFLGRPRPCRSSLAGVVQPRSAPSRGDDRRVDRRYGRWRRSPPSAGSSPLRASGGWGGANRGLFRRVILRHRLLVGPRRSPARHAKVLESALPARCRRGHRDHRQVIGAEGGGSRRVRASEPVQCRWSDGHGDATRTQGRLHSSSSTRKVPGSSPARCGADLDEAHEPQIRRLAARSSRLGGGADGGASPTVAPGRAE